MIKQYIILVLGIMLIMSNMSAVFATPSILYSTDIAPSQILSSSSTASIIVATDKSSYDDGEKIMISGSTRDHLSGTSVTVMIRNPVGNLIKVDQIDLAAGGKFSTTLTAGGTLMQLAGVYQVLVQYGSKDKTAQTWFVFTGPVGGNFMKVDGTDYSVSYHMTNGAILGIKADPTSKLLRVSILTTGDGTLTIELPRTLVDAQKNGKDDKFLVSENGVQTVFQETNTAATDRTLSIPFTNGLTEIDIIGTFIIPEFGSMLTFVLVIATILVIFLPRIRLLTQN